MENVIPNALNDLSTRWFLIRNYIIYQEKNTLLAAARRKKLSIFIQLLEQGADPNQDRLLLKLTKDHYDSISGRHERYFQYASILLDYGADPNKMWHNKKDQTIETIFSRIILSNQPYINNSQGNYEKKLNNESYKKFITKLITHANPYLRLSSGDNIIEALQEKLQKGKFNPDRYHFFNFLLEQVQSATTFPKSLKELAMRRILQLNVPYKEINILPFHLAEEIDHYAQRKDMIHLIKQALYLKTRSYVILYYY